MTLEFVQPRCQYCGTPHQGHPTECIKVTEPSFDQSQEHLARIDDAAGQLLKAIMKHRSIEMLQNSTYGAEFFNLMDMRRKM